MIKVRLLLLLIVSSTFAVGRDPCKLHLLWGQIEQLPVLVAF